MEHPVKIFVLLTSQQIINRCLFELRLTYVGHEPNNDGKFE